MKGCLVLLLALVTSSRLSAGETAVAVATITGGFVSGITVSSGGSGYATEPAVTLSGGGGSGASAKVILAGDKVGSIVVLTAGSGYTTAPTVLVEAPPKALGVKLEWIPKLTVEGPAGSPARLESAVTLAGPWESWTNVTVGSEGTVLVDLRAGSMARFYRVVQGAPTGPAGFVWIPPGSFVMGSPLAESGRYFDEVQHSVTLTQGFWMSDHEATQSEYQSVTGINPASFKGEDRPVEQVSWIDASTYCLKLTERERAAGRITIHQEYRLPTEAEWEYACRAGTTGSLTGELDAIGWYLGNSHQRTEAVRLKAPNSWGLYDMIGNLWEWCSDWYGDLPPNPVTDPKGPVSGSVRVCRGSSWGLGREECRAANRNWSYPVYHDSYAGFRPVLSAVR